MKKLTKTIIILIMIAFFIIINIVTLQNETGKSNVYAANNSGTSDVQLLARAINGEARGEPYEGQVAVGAVILNRVKSSKFPNTIAGVI